MKKLRSVLLVDDDNTANFLNQLIIEEMRVSSDVIIKGNGLEALQFIQDRCFQAGVLTPANCPELILLDINMPVMNGFELLEALRGLAYDISAHTQVVMLSSSDNAQDVSAARRLGVRYYVSKPLTEAKMNQVLVAIS